MVGVGVLQGVLRGKIDHRSLAQLAPRPIVVQYSTIVSIWLYRSRNVTMSKY